MSSLGIPGYIAPWLGAAVAGGIGFYVAHYEMSFNPPSIATWFTLGTAIAGFAIGCAFWFVEFANRPK